MPVSDGGNTTIQSVQKVFAEREYVDMERACHILGASWSMVNRMAASGYLILVDFRRRGRKRVNYASIIEHCDRLRQEYAIPDRRSPLSSELRRYRDDDILPFPLRDTIGATDAAPMLGYQVKWSALKLCEEGRFEAYRLHPGAPWRISLPSLQKYLEEITKGIHGGAAAYKSGDRTVKDSATSF